MSASTVERVTNRRGLGLLVRRWEPSAAPWGSVCIVHGLAEHSGRYERTGEQLAAAGLNAVALDLTGLGASGGRRGHVPDLDYWLDDVADLLSGAGDASPGAPQVLLGHSMGGLVALAYALSNRPRPDALVISAPALGSDVAAWKKALAPLLGRLRMFSGAFQGCWFATLLLMVFRGVIG